MKATKTFKIGEYARGGVITAEVNGNTVTIIAKEWDFTKGSRRSSDQKNAKEMYRITGDASLRSTERGLLDWLCDETTSYYADQILDWVKTKVKFAQNSW